MIFFNRPIAAVGMIASLLLLISIIIPSWRKKKKAIPVEEVS